MKSFEAWSWKEQHWEQGRKSSAGVIYPWLQANTEGSAGKDIRYGEGYFSISSARFGLDDVLLSGTWRCFMGLGG